MGGGGFSMEPDNPLLDDFILEMARELRGLDRPRVCFLGTASGDSDGYLAGFYAAFARKADAAHLALFVRTVADVDAFLRDQDVIYVGGGNTENLLAIWRLHGVDRALRAAWDGGVVLAGLSAGSICWFESGTTDSFGRELAVLTDGLGFLRGSHCPHYDGELARRPAYRDLIRDGRLPAGYAVDDSAAVVFDGTGVLEAVCSVDGAAAYRVELVDGEVRETRLPTRYLGG
jgi:peptidase E